MSYGITDVRGGVVYSAHTHNADMLTGTHSGTRDKRHTKKQTIDTHTSLSSPPSPPLSLSCFLTLFYTQTDIQ